MAVLLIGAAATVANPPKAWAAPADVASTRTVIAIAIRDLTTSMVLFKRVEASANALIEHIATTCPAAMGGDPRNGTAAQQHTRDAFVQAGALELLLGELRPLSASINSEARTIEKLHWSQPSLRRIIAAKAAGLHVVNLSRPDLCSAAAVARRNAFASVPPAITSFFRATKALVPGDTPTWADLVHLLKPYEPRSEAAAARRVRVLQARSDSMFSNFSLRALARLLDAVFGAN